MSLEEEELNQNEWVRWLLNKDHKAELWEILAFWEKCKKEWEEMRKEFWSRWWGRDKYVNLLMQYKDRKKEYMENLTEEEKNMLDRLNGMWKDKFIEEYLYNKILYSGDADIELNKKSYWYDDWKAWKVIMEEWAMLNLHGNNILNRWAEAISKMELKEWVYLDLSRNNIWEVWAKRYRKWSWKNEWGWIWIIITFEINEQKRYQKWN